MLKKTFFFIDDVIWVFRDLTRQRPASLFDNPFMKCLKDAHDRYGMKVQLHVFYRTDFFYGDDEFTLADMTDAYKAEWKAASDWLKLGFHAKQEFPDYPYINASYEDAKNGLDAVKREIIRFAGPDSFAASATLHWGAMSKEGCIALREGGIKLLSVSVGEKRPYNEDPDSLPYGHAARLLQNRKPESSVFIRDSKNTAVTFSLCGYNYLTAEKNDPIYFKRQTYFDKETGLHFKKLYNSVVLNLSTLEEVPQELSAFLDKEYVGYATHEQYFYPEYYAYQPDYAEKIDTAAKLLTENGFVFFFAEEMAENTAE